MCLILFCLQPCFQTLKRYSSENKRLNYATSDVFHYKFIDILLELYRSQMLVLRGTN